MDKSSLINKIMSEVKDEKLRDSLLKSISEDNNENSNNSNILNELEKLGINSSAASSYVKSGLKTGSIIGQLLGLVFVMVGGYFTIFMILHGFSGNAFIPALFCLGGIFSIYNSRKLSKVIN